MRNKKFIKGMASLLFVALSVVGCKGNWKSNEGTSDNQVEVSVSTEAGGETSAQESSTPEKEAGTGSEGDNNSETMPVSEEREKLTVCDSHPLCFKIGDKEVTMEESLGVAIVDVQWINSTQIGVTINVDRSVNYFTVYNAAGSTYEFHATGAEFVWKDEDIRTLYYLESTPSGVGEMSHYWIKDYNGEICYESKEAVSDLMYEEDGELHFMVQTADGTMDETLSKEAK